ncbi:hypothetical protein P9X10_00990 [Bacillus cereus]|nr:hypothetical protein [Bacillus cereus]
MILESLGIYCMVGSFVIFLTKDKLYVPITRDSDYPFVLLIIMTVFWLPIILVALFLAGRDRLYVLHTKRSINIKQLIKDLGEDDRFVPVETLKGTMFHQYRGSCICCGSVDNPMKKTERFGSKNNPTLRIDLYVCLICTTQGITGLDILERDYKGINK